MLKISLKVLYCNLGKEYFSDYRELSRRFRKSIKLDAGDFTIAEKHLQLGWRVVIIAYHQDKPVGMVRLDLRGEPKIGDLYVEPEFRGQEVTLEQAWIESENKYKIWQYLIKAAYIIGRRADFKKVESYPHTKTGRELRKWRDLQIPKWEKEIKKIYEPSEILNRIKSKLPSFFEPITSML